MFRFHAWETVFTVFLSVTLFSSHQSLRPINEMLIKVAKVLKLSRVQEVLHQYIYHNSQTTVVVSSTAIGCVCIRTVTQHRH